MFLNQVSRVEVARVYNTGDGVLNLTLTWMQAGGSLSGVQVEPAALSLEVNESRLVYLVVNATSLEVFWGEVEIKPSAPKANATGTGGVVLPMFTVEANITVVKPLTPAAFTFSGLVVSPADVAPGTEVTVSVTVKNTGEQSGTYSAKLKLDDATKETKTGTLVGGASTIVTFTILSQTEGTHMVQVGDLTGSFTAVKPPTPATFTYTGLTVSPTDVKPGDEVTISVTVQNTGEQPGIYSAELKFNGATKETKTGTLVGGATTTVVFKVSSQTEGTHTVQVGDQTSSFTVVKPSTGDTGGAAISSAPSPEGANLGLLLAPVVGGAATLALLVIRSKLKRASDRTPSLKKPDKVDKTRGGGKRGGRRKG